MRRGLTISCIGHACALVWGLVVVSAQPMESPPVDALPISFISDKDFTQLTQGVKNAPKLKVDDIKPLADTIDTPKPVDQLAPKATAKPSISTESSAAKAQPKPDPKPAAKPDPKPATTAEKPKAPDYKPDQIADLLKKDDSKKPTKPGDQPTPDKPARDAPKFNADQVAELLDHRDPQRQIASGAVLSDTANLGAVTGAPSAQMSQSEIDALRARISQCWNPPAGVDAQTKVYIVLRTLFKPDGSLAQRPVVVEGSASALGPALAESAMRALLTCQPFTMLKPEHYDQWKDLELKFDPQELLGG
jgi:colicin import membrane protein